MQQRRRLEGGKRPFVRPRDKGQFFGFKNPDGVIGVSGGAGLDVAERQDQSLRRQFADQARSPDRRKTLPAMVGDEAKDAALVMQDAPGRIPEGAGVKAVVRCTIRNHASPGLFSSSDVSVVGAVRGENQSLMRAQ